MLAFDVFPSTWFVASKSHPALASLCLIYSPICEIFMCSFYTTFLIRYGRSYVSGTATCLRTSVPAVRTSFW